MQRFVRTPHPLAAASAVLLLGFGVLLAFWLLGAWTTPRGLFTYRAATVGDAVLLPLIVGVLVAALRIEPLRASRNARLERQVGMTASIAGAMAGVGLQALWLLDPTPTTNWTLPEPHTFNAPGWWHAGFFVAILGLIAGLACVAAVRVRVARKSDIAEADQLASSIWLVALVASVTLFGALVAVDDVTVSSAGPSLVPLAVGTVAALILLVVAFGWSGEALYSAALGITIAIGAGALFAVGLPVRWPIAAVGAWGAWGVGVAVSDPLSRRGDRVLLRAVAATLALFAGIGVAFATVGEHAEFAVLSVFAGASLAVAIGVPSIRDEPAIALLVFAVAYMLGLTVAAAWTDGRPTDKTDAALTVGAALTLLDALVLSVVRDRFRDFMASAQGSREAKAPAPRADGPQAWTLLLALVLTTLPALALLLGVAAEGLALDDAAPSPNGSLTFLLGIAGAAAACALAALAVGVVRRKTSEELKDEGPPDRPESAGAEERAALGMTGGANALPGPDPKTQDDRGTWRARFDPFPYPLAPSPVAVSLAAVGAVALSAAVASSVAAPLHYAVFAVLAACVMGALTFEDIINSPVRLQLATPALTSWIVAGLAAITSATATFWLITNGLWNGDQPASILGCFGATVVALAVPAVIAIAAGLVNACGLTSGGLTEQAAWWNACVQPPMYAGVALVGIVMPVCIAGRVAASGIENAGLATLAAAGVIPPVLALFQWVLKANNVHREYECSVLPDVVRAEAERRHVDVDAFNRARQDALRWHALFVNRVTTVLVVGGLGWGLYAATLA